MDEKVYTPEVIEENPLPGGIEPFVLPTSSPKDTYAPTTSKETTVNRKRTAVELLSTSLNTRSRKVLQEFKLEQSGGFQIGNFQEGLSGDMRLTPNGITARDIAGLTTFAIDGTSGNATFAGEIRSGALVTGQVSIGVDGDGSLIIYENGIPTVLIGAF